MGIKRTHPDHLRETEMHLPAKPLNPEKKEKYTGGFIFRADANKSFTSVPHNWKVLQTTKDGEISLCL